MVGRGLSRAAIAPQAALMMADRSPLGITGIRETEHRQHEVESDGD